MLQNRVSLGPWSYIRPGPAALSSPGPARQTAFMRGRSSRRNVVLSAVVAAAAYFTACPPYAVSPLSPGRPDAPRGAASTPSAERRARGGEDLRDALNAVRPPPLARGPSGRSAAALTRGPASSAPGMTRGDVPHAPPVRVHALSPGSGRAASADVPHWGVADVREGRPRARAASLGRGRTAAGGEASAGARADGDDPLGAAHVRETPRPPRGAARPALWSEEESSDGAVDLRRGGRRRRGASLFEPAPRPRREVRKTAAKPRRFRPLRLSQLLGGKALRPPPSSLRPPVGLAGLELKRPFFDAAGRVVPAPSREVGALEAVTPEEMASDRRQDAHWDGETWHERHAHGLTRDGGWLWLLKDRQRWWGLAARTSLVRHQSLWWLRQNDVWLVLHEGEPWAWRHFQDWDEAEGLFHLGTGTEIVYSSDLSRAAVITPGEGAVIYDARSGAEIGSIPEEDMPARRRPKAPKSLSLP